MKNLLVLIDSSLFLIHQKGRNTMKSTTIKPIENGSGVIKVLKFSMILINYKIETIDSETALCKVRHGRIIIDSKQYDFKIIDDDNKFLQFFLPLKMSKGLSYSDIFNPYIEALVAIDDRNTTIDPMIILEKLEKEMVTIVSLSKVKIPLRKLNRDHDIIWKKKKEKHALDKFLLNVPFNMIYMINKEYNVDHIGPIRDISDGPYKLEIEDSVFKSCGKNERKIRDILMVSNFGEFETYAFETPSNPSKCNIKIPYNVDSENKLSIVKNYMSSNYRNKSYIILNISTYLENPDDEDSRIIDTITIDKVVLI